MLFSSPYKTLSISLPGSCLLYFFISLLDAFDFADTKTVQDASRIIYETSTELVHSRDPPS